MTGAMYAAVSGLKAHMSALNVIGQNISNVNTNAYKATRYTFLEALYTTVRGGSNGSTQVGGRNPAQNGYGASIGTIDLDMSTKNYTPTGRAMDVMIDGDGFFIVGDKTSYFGSEGGKELKDMYLSRLGNFDIDSQGYLVDGQGQVIYGYLSVANPVYTKMMTPGGQGSLLNADGKLVDAERLWDPKKDPAAIAGLVATSPYFMDGDGQLLKVTNIGTADKPKFEVAVVDEFTPAPVLTPIRLPKQDDNGKAIYPTWDQDPDSLTYGQIIDGAGAKTIGRDSISIDENTGRITCTTTKGQAVVVGAIAIAKVENPNGVTHVDGHYYQALDGAGDIRLTSIGHSVKNSNDPESPFYVPPQNAGDPVGMKGGEIPIESSGGTKCISGGLESSGTDLASEISNMIMIQRGYQANTRIVTVTDSMLEELVNMKR